MVESRNAPNGLALSWYLATAPSTTSKNPLSRINNAPPIRFPLAKNIADIIAINGEIIVTIFGLIFNRLAKGSKNFVRYGRKLLSIILLY
jgi:hypothetical protein